MASAWLVITPTTCCFLQLTGSAANFEQRLFTQKFKEGIWEECIVTVKTKAVLS
jgi:hypothetical protein